MDNKIALVTGGTSGIGKEIAKLLLENGVQVIINYGNNDDQANKAISEFKSFEDKILLVKADVSKEKEVISMFKKIENKFGRLDFLINNAGTNVDSFIENFDVTNWDKILDINLKGKFICTKHAVKLMRKSKNASIINIASRLGIKPCEEASAYCVAEAGVINFTKCSAMEFAKDKIRVNSISPTLTITPMALSGWSEQEIEMTKENNPMKRLGEPIDIANMVLYLCSDEAKYITGQNISINGGALL